MNYREAMAELKKMGTAQNRKVYARHGVGEDMFGVSYANLGKLKKETRVNHSLALQLWDSRNHDARVLATMIAEPARLDNKTVEAWVKGLDNYIVTDAFAGLVTRSDLAQRKMSKWTKSKQEWVGRAGWLLVAGVAAADNELPEAYFGSYLSVIENTIHQSKNRVRDAMIMAVINIGLRSPGLEKKAIAAAKRIGHVDVDHGQTSCKTPDAIEYIARTKAQREKKANKGKK